MKQKRTAADILEECAKTFREKNKIYGSNYKMVGEVMIGLFPNGVTLNTAHDFNRFHILMLKVVKDTRYTVNWEKGHHDSVRDGTVYGAMLEWIDELGPGMGSEPFDAGGSRVQNLRGRPRKHLGRGGRGGLPLGNKMAMVPKRKKVKGKPATNKNIFT